MTSENSKDDDSVNLANQIIDMANSKLDDYSVENVAEALRHAAANFSGFAYHMSEQAEKDPNETVENFISFYEYYLGIHKPESEAGIGLAHTIAQAKNEL